MAARILIKSNQRSFTDGLVLGCLATVAGRLTSKVPVRWLIGPGLLLVGAGLLLMRGLDSRDFARAAPGGQEGARG